MNLRTGSKFLGIAISAITILVFAFIYGPENLIRSLSNLPDNFYLFFLLAIALHIASFFFWALRIELLSRSNGYKMSFSKALITVVSSLFAASITPGYVGGEPVRIKKLVDYGEPVGTATAIALGERGFDSIFFVGMFALVVLTGLEILTGDLKIIAVVGLIVLILFLFFLLASMRAGSLMKKIEGWLEKTVRWFDRKERKYEERLPKIIEHVETYAKSTKEIFIKHPVALVLGIAVTSLMWLSDFMVPAILIFGFGATPILIDVVFIQVLLVLVSLIPITPGSAGIMEVLMVATFTPFLPSGGIVAFVLLWRFITFYFNLIIGSLFMHHVVTK